MTTATALKLQQTPEGLTVSDDDATRRRKRLIAMVHAGAHRLSLDDETRRAMQLSVTGCRSCADMDDNQLRACLAALNARGAQLHYRPRHPASGDRSPLLRKVEALTHAGRYPWPDYPLGISKRMWRDAAPAKLEWHSPKQLRALVAALSYDAKRRASKTPPGGDAA